MLVVIFFSPLVIKFCLNAVLNALWSDRILIHNGRLFHSFSWEYIKLCFNKSNLGQGTVSFGECLFWLEWKLNFRCEDAVHNQILFYALLSLYQASHFLCAPVHTYTPFWVSLEWCISTVRFKFSSNLYNF